MELLLHGRKQVTEMVPTTVEGQAFIGAISRDFQYSKKGELMPTCRLPVSL